MLMQSGAIHSDGAIHLLVYLPPQKIGYFTKALTHSYKYTHKHNYSSYFTKHYRWPYFSYVG